MLNDQIYMAINNGESVQGRGFLVRQAIYAAAFKVPLKTLLAAWKRCLQQQTIDPFLWTGDTFTEADLRLFPNALSP
jgi:glutathionyl-hydroquinone reductase